MVKMKRWLFGALGAALLLSGCSVEMETQGRNTGPYPLDTDIELTHWIELNDDVRFSTDKFGDTPFAKTLAEETGVRIKYISIANGNGADALNLMIASRELPDLISYPWYRYPGGTERALAEQIIQPLTNLIAQYSPNLNTYLEEHPEIKKMVTTDQGEYTMYPFIRGDESLTVYSGPMVRKDWLEATGRQTLETVDDWYGFLTDMKNRGVEKPLILTQTGIENGFLTGAFGVIPDSYVENGKVVFGAVQPGYRQFLQTLRQWYGEGLVAKELFSPVAMDRQNMLDGSGAATFGYAGSTMGTLLKELQAQDPAADLIGVPNPVLERGQTPKFTQKDFLATPANCVSITTQCKYPEIAARYLDYGYSREGMNLYNYGIEGESYTMQDGQPVYTDLILNNSDGLTASQALALYTQTYSGPFIQEKRYADMYYSYPQQREAVETWARSDVDQYQLPMISIGEEEYEEYSRIYTAVTEYRDKALVEFVMGVRPIEEFDQYVSEMRDLGLERMLEIQQAAYERYQKK